MSRLVRIARYIIPKRYHARVRGAYNRLRLPIILRFRSYGPAKLLEALGRVGVANGDVLFVHAGFTPFFGFKGSAKDAVDVLLEAVGASGTLLMPSMPYTGSTADYLRESPLLDVRLTPSRMGIVTEVFRRRKGVIRSNSPTHPVLAFGRDARQILEGHEKCAFPCGRGSPFERILEHDATILFFGVPPTVMTFVHYVEDVAAPQLPLEVYEAESRIGVVKTEDGRCLEIPIRAFSETAVNTRRIQFLLDELQSMRAFRRTRVGNTRLIAVKAKDVMTAGIRLLERKPTFIFDT